MSSGSEVVGRRDDRAGDLIGEGLEDDQRGQDVAAVLTSVGAPLRPLPPPRLGAGESRVSVLGMAGALVGGEPAEAEPLAGAFVDGELRHRGEILPVHLHRCAQVHRVGPRLGDDAVGHALYPGHDQAVPEADDQLHAHRDATSQPLNDAHELRGAAIAGRHEVDDPRRAVGGLEVGLQDQRPLAVAARHDADLPGGGDKPAPMLLLSQQRGEARCGVEVGQAQPVHRAVAANQGRGLQVTDQRVILNPHGKSSPDMQPALPLRKRAPRVMPLDLGLGWKFGVWR
jgi:hypothetical protein